MNATKLLGIAAIGLAGVSAIIGRISDSKNLDSKVAEAVEKALKESK